MLHVQFLRVTCVICKGHMCYMCDLCSANCVICAHIVLHVRFVRVTCVTCAVCAVCEGHMCYICDLYGAHVLHVRLMRIKV